MVGGAFFCSGCEQFYVSVSGHIPDFCNECRGILADVIKKQRKKLKKEKEDEFDPI